jgi:DNA-binding NarL/FixJ family response regulator
LLIAERRAARSARAILTAKAVKAVQCETLADAIARAGEIDPSVVLLFAEGSTRELARAIEALRGAFAQSSLILITPSIERWELRAALAAGASGVLLEDQDLTRSLPGCLAAVLAGQVCVPRRHGRQIAPPALSTREKQILGLVVMGYMNCQIAERLFLAESTVKSHLSSAFGKLGVRSRNEAVSMILDPARGLGTGILALAGEPQRPASRAAQQLAGATG